MITVFTPAYNRANRIHRVFDSLREQTWRDFEWVIVDDGSTDHTRQVVEGFQKEADFPIRYFYQENQGKHMATNRAVREAKGELFITLDSDDGCKSNALERLMAVWETVPEEQRHLYKGVSCRTCRPESADAIIGTPLPRPVLDSSDHDLRYRHKVKGELWGMTRRQVLLENPYPTIEGLHFYPEGAYWGKIGQKYRTRYFDEALRLYYVDGDAGDNQLTKRLNPRETYYIREYMLSPEVIRPYFWCDPVNFYMQAVAFLRDGFLTNRGTKTLFATAGATKRGWMLCLLGYLPAKLLQWKAGK